MAGIKALFFVLRVCCIFCLSLIFGGMAKKRSEEGETYGKMHLYKSAGIIETANSLTSYQC